MSVFALVSAVIEESGSAGVVGRGIRGVAPARPLAFDEIGRRAIGIDGGEDRFTVALVAGRVYTIELEPVPRGVRSMVSLYGPAGDLVGCHSGWARVRLVQSAQASGLHAVVAEVGPGAEALVVRVQPWTSEEVARAIEDPLYVL